MHVSDIILRERGVEGEGRSAPRKISQYGCLQQQVVRFGHPIRPLVFNSEFRIYAVKSLPSRLRPDRNSKRFLCAQNRNSFTMKGTKVSFGRFGI